MSIVLLTSPALPVFPSFWLLYCANSKQYVDLSNKTPQHSPSNPSPTPLNPPEQTMLRRAIVNKRTLLGSRFLSTLPQSSVGPVIPPTLAALTDRAQVDESTSLMSSLVSDLNQKLDAVRMGRGEGAVRRLREREKMLPRERIDYLLDPNSAFLEVRRGRRAVLQAGVKRQQHTAGAKRQQKHYAAYYITNPRISPFPRWLPSLRCPPSPVPVSTTVSTSPAGA